MYSKNLSNLGKGTQKVDVNLNSLARGTYLLQVISEKNTSTAKLVIVR